MPESFSFILAWALGDRLGGKGLVPSHPVSFASPQFRSNTISTIPLWLFFKKILNRFPACREWKFWEFMHMLQTSSKEKIAFKCIGCWQAMVLFYAEIYKLDVEARKSVCFPSLLLQAIWSHPFCLVSFLLLLSVLYNCPPFPSPPFLISFLGLLMSQGFDFLGPATSLWHHDIPTNCYPKLRSQNPY